jgi:hypothetical protein
VRIAGERFVETETAPAKLPCLTSCWACSIWPRRQVPRELQVEPARPGSPELCSALRQLGLHGDRLLALLLPPCVRHQRQQLVEIGDRARIVTLGAEQLAARE